MEKYKVGTKLIHNESGIIGVVVENFKLSGDICIAWNTGFIISYDSDNLDENCSVIK